MSDDRTRWRNGLIVHYLAACSLARALDDAPRWRRRRRRKLEADLTRECNRADLARRMLGSAPGARPLRELLDESLEAIRSRG